MMKTFGREISHGAGLLSPDSIGKIVIRKLIVNYFMGIFNSGTLDKTIPKHSLIPEKGIKVYGADYCFFCRRTKAFLNNN